MRRLLPKVHPDVGYSIAAEFKETIPDITYYNKMMTLIERENPAIAEFIKKWSNSEDEFDSHSAFCGILVYTLLRGQSEVNEMNRTIRL